MYLLKNVGNTSVIQIVHLVMIDKVGDTFVETN